MRSRPDSTLCAVVRPFSAAGVELERGEIVNVSDWRNPTPLIEQRRLAVIHSDIAPSTKCECGRTWLDETALLSHNAKSHQIADQTPRRVGRPKKAEAAV